MPAFKRNKTLGRVIRRGASSASCADAVGPLEPGCEIFGLTCGRYSLIDLVEHCLSHTGPADLIVSTWTVGRADIGFAMRLIGDGRVRSLRLVVPASFAARQPDYLAAVREAFGDHAVRLVFHALPILLITNDDWRLAIRTTMALNESRRMEMFEISDCPELADWLSTMIDDVFAGRPVEWGGPVEPGRYLSDDPTGNDVRRAGVTRR